MVFSEGLRGMENSNIKMSEELPKLEQKEKPDFLYHGSPHRIEELEPRTKPHREKEEGKLVFATSETGDASMFLYKTALTGHFMIKGERIGYTVIVEDKDEFLKNDKGGHIHVLLSETFEPTPHSGMSNEWVSKEGVKPEKVMEYDSALNAMIEYGIQVYFVDNDTYQKIRRAEDHGYSIFKNLQSENQLRGVNVKEFK